MNVVMIMCHKNPEQVIRFASKCLTEKTDVIIHCDSSMEDSQFQKIKEFSEKIRGVHLTNQRIHGELDRRTLVDIAMLMVLKAKSLENERKHYDYFLLCSGQDYLIKSMDFIEKELESAYPKPFIDCTPYSKNNWVFHKFNTNRMLLDYEEWIRSKSGIIRKLARLSQILLRYIYKLRKKLSYDKLIQSKVDLYGGSAWWILPDKIISFICREYCEKENAIQQLLLDDSVTPEETYFQIMSMCSPLKEMVDINPVDMVEQNCKTWAYFSDDDKPFKGHPYIFTEKEFEKIKNSDCWFARKFDIYENSDILDMVDNELLN